MKRLLSPSVAGQQICPTSPHSIAVPEKIERLFIVIQACSFSMFFGLLYPLGNLTVKWTKNSSLIYLWQITKEFRGHVYDNCYSIPHQQLHLHPCIELLRGFFCGIPGHPAEFASNQVWKICMDEHPMSVSTYVKYHKIHVTWKLGTPAIS